LLRYFEQRFSQVGEALGASASRPQARDRALDRLREYLVKRGIRHARARPILSANAVEAVPVRRRDVDGKFRNRHGGEVGFVRELNAYDQNKIAIGGVLWQPRWPHPCSFNNGRWRMRAPGGTLQERPRTPATPTQAASPNLMADADRDRADLERLRRESADLQTRLMQLAAREQEAAATKAARKSADDARMP
jgi:hypothetical protein